MKILRILPTVISYILEFFEDAYNDNIIWANMGGVEGSLDDGLQNLSLTLSPHIEEFIGEFNIPVNKVLYRVSNFVYELRKKLRNKH